MDPTDHEGLVPPDSRTGVVFGGHLVFAFSPVVGFQPEFLYVNKGASYEGSGRTYSDDIGDFVNVDWKEKTKLDYFEIPLLLRISPGPGASARPFLLAGPALALKPTAKDRAEVTASYGSQRATVQTETDLDDVKSLDFAGVVGAGLEFPVGSATLLLEARYTLGLTSIDDSPADLDAKNGPITLLAGVGF